MKLQIVPLEFRRDSQGHPVWKDERLYLMLEEFTANHLVDKPEYSDYARVWLAVEVDDNEQPLSVQGVIGYVLQPDITLIRATNPGALIRLTSRISSFFSDNGAHGYPVLVYINPDENPKQKCPNVEETLQAWNAVPANRWQVRVR
jgi:hypothetical protein